MANTVPGNLTSQRGQVTKYLYYREDLELNDPDYNHNAEVTGKQGSDSLQGIPQGDVTAFLAAYGWTSGGEVLTYNPKTDRYAVKNGECVL